MMMVSWGEEGELVDRHNSWGWYLITKEIKLLKRSKHLVVQPLLMLNSLLISSLVIPTSRPNFAVGDRSASESKPRLVGTISIGPIEAAGRLAPSQRRKVLTARFCS